MSSWNFMLSSGEHEASFITTGALHGYLFTGVWLFSRYWNKIVRMSVTHSITAGIKRPHSRNNTGKLRTGSGGSERSQSRVSSANGPRSASRYKSLLLIVQCVCFTRVKSGNFVHQVNSDIHLQTVEIQMRRLLIRIFTVCLVNLSFIPIFEIWNKQGRYPN